MQELIDRIVVHWFELLCLVLLCVIAAHTTLLTWNTAANARRLDLAVRMLDQMEDRLLLLQGQQPS